MANATGVGVGVSAQPTATSSRSLESSIRTFMDSVSVSSLEDEICLYQILFARLVTRHKVNKEPKKPFIEVFKDDLSHWIMISNDLKDGIKIRERGSVWYYVDLLRAAINLYINQVGEGKNSGSAYDRWCALDDNVRRIYLFSAYSLIPLQKCQMCFKEFCLLVQNFYQLQSEDEIFKTSETLWMELDVIWKQMVLRREYSDT